ncbi:hypothetical protein CAOG_03146 [Capsaspora owczarzaki ATCC 30864]|nr:hypothetical protein CAOG_03146 [Capsaspora owczarzaki ATCC 30864]|eukprot:XP_004363985.1 hypothetical protein CAOG_03146 [Capsaspora owczarzaki ATCC 30864]
MSDIELLNVRASDAGVDVGGGTNASSRELLFTACKSGDLKLLKECLAVFKPAQIVTMLDDDGWGPFHFIAMKGHLELAKAMVAHGVPVDIRDKYGTTPMYRAVGFGHPEMVYYLVANGGNVHHLNDAGDNMIHNSGWAGGVELTRFFISKGVSPTAKDKANHLGLMDMIKTMPNVCGEFFDSRVKVLDKYLLAVHSEYDFDGIDDQDDDVKEITPLEIIVKKSNHDLIGHPLIRKLCQWKWETFARSYFLRQFFSYLFALACLTYICISIIAYPGTVLYIYDDPQTYVRGILEIIFVLFVFLQVYNETQEFIDAGRDIVRVPSGPAGWILRIIFPKAVDPALVNAAAVSIPRYFRDLGNVFDLSTYLMVIVDLGFRIANIVAYKNGDPPKVGALYEYNVLAIISVLFWTKFLRIAALFKSTGPLIETIKRMLIDLIIFMAIFTVFLMGFSISFFLLLSPEVSPPIAAAGTPDYESFQQSLLTVFLGLVGQLNTDPFRLADKSVAYIGYVVYIIISNIALLNLLIAMLSNTYATVKYVSDLEFLLVRARYILAVQKSLGKARVRKILAADLKKRKAQARSVTKENNTPEAELTTTDKYSEWIKLKETEEPREVNLQLLRDDLQKMSNLQFEEVHAAFDKLSDTIKLLNERIDLLVAK